MGFCKDIGIQQTRPFAIIGMLCLLLTFWGCKDEAGDQLAECQFVFNYFELQDLDYVPGIGYHGMQYYYPGEGYLWELDASLIETPSAGTSGYLVLRNEQGDDYRLKPVHSMNWEGQLDGLQLGKTYHFVLWFCEGIISGMKILDDDSLLYLTFSYSSALEGSLDKLEQRLNVEQGFLEGFTAHQLHKTKCKEIEGRGWSLPMVFQYEEQTATLYQGQEATFTTSHGQLLVHVIYSRGIVAENYKYGDDCYSFYIKRP